MTLKVPMWTRELAAEGWANIHDIVDQPPRLTAVDAFLGDTSAHTLILGKDCAPASAFRKLVRAGVLDPYRHNPNLATNRMLSKVLDKVGVEASLDGSSASVCGLYYANAYWLLRDDHRFSGALHNSREAYNQSSRVLSYLFEELPLTRVIAMGKDSYEVLMKYFGLKESWRDNLHKRRAVRAGELKICASVHLGHYGVRNRVAGATRDECIDAINSDWSEAFDA